VPYGFLTLVARVPAWGAAGALDSRAPPREASPMLDPRPVFYVIGLLTVLLGLFMLPPMAVDLYDADPNWRSFALSSFVTVIVGAAVTLVCRQARRPGLSIHQIFLLTTLTWAVLPVFAAIPLMTGAPAASLADGVFEAMSGLTTTGSTVFAGLDYLPRGTLLWRGLLQWMGGVGIIVVALAFLPTMKVGGMQFFRSEGFDTLGKILPRAAEIALSISWIYLVLTAACILAYEAAGMPLFEAVVHAMTTMSTGGFSTNDASFGKYVGLTEYIASVFMILASLPFVRFVQLAAGNPGPLLRDPQAQFYLGLIVVLVLSTSAYRMVHNGDELEPALREGLFNITSILSGTGYASVDYMQWGSFPVAVFFVIGLIGGCTGSTACSVKIFRYQIALAAIRAQIRRIHSPHGVFTPRYAGRPVEPDVINSVSAFFVLFFFTLAVVSILLSLMGLDTITAVSGAATALANIGPGLGEQIGPAGNFSELDDAVKWVLTATMLAGRLELFAVYVLFTRRFWAP